MITTFYDHALEISRQEKVSMAEALREIRDLGIEGVEVSENKLLGREDELGNELACAGLCISSIPAYFDFGRDTEVIKQAEPTLEAARFLGIKRLLVSPGFFRQEDGEEERERQVERMISCVNQLAELAASYGVSLILEDYDNSLAPFSTLQGVKRFLEGCPGLSCCFDTGNFAFSGEEELSAYEALKDRIAYVHLKDRAYAAVSGEAPSISVDGKALYPCPVGSGELKLSEILSRLKRDGYRGNFALEHYGAKEMLSYLRRSAAWLKEQL